MTVPTAKAINYTAAVTTATPLSRTPMSGSLIVCIENDAAILDGMKTLLTAWDAEVIAVADPDAAIEAIEAAGRPGHRSSGRLSSRSRQRRRRDPRHSPPLRREHSGDPDHRRSQPACAGRGARRKDRGAQQAGQAGIAAGAARAVADAADGGGGVGRCAILTRITPERITCASATRVTAAIGVPCRHWPPAIFAARSRLRSGSRRRAFAGSPRHAP